MLKPYCIPLNEIRREQIVINSRFVATLAPVFSTDQARAFIARIREELQGASHHVSAYVIGGGNAVIEYCSDDGEPSGTAGRPALAVLRGSGLGDAAIVITRTFGGTLLGTGGLVKAYTESAQSVVQAVGRGRKIQSHVIMIALPYSLLERIRLIAAKRHAIILAEDFGADITMTIQIPITDFDPFQRDVKEISAGKLSAEIIETKEIVMTVSA